MKSLARNILFVAVLLLYIVSTMGYGVHRCTMDGTASLIVLFGETPCEYVHSHTDAHGNSYTHAHHPNLHHDCSGEGSGACGHHHKHDSNCCSTNVYVLTHDQDTACNSNLIAPVFALDLGNIQKPVESECCGNVHSAQIPSDSFYSLCVQTGLQEVFCTFRV